MSKHVVHCRRSRYDVYIGRGNDPKTGTPGKWGNPFIIGVHGDRDEVIAQYEAVIRSDERAMAIVKKELKGRILGCWCSPEACHGDVLAKIANEEES